MAQKSNKLKVKPPVKKVGETSSKTKKITSRKTKTAKKKNVAGSKKSIFNNVKLRRSFGFLFLIIGIYLFLALTTFIINWFTADSSDTVQLATKNFVDHTETVTNWTGKVGSLIAKYIIYNGVGIGSYFISLLFAAIGLKMLLNVKLLSLWRWFELMIISFIWIPITFNLIFSSHPENLFGGVVGFMLNGLLVSYIGDAGLVLLIIFIPVIFILIDFNLVFNFNLLKKKKTSSQHADNKDVIPKDISKKETEGLYNTIEFAVDEKDELEIVKPQTGTGNSFKIEEDKSVKSEVNTPEKDDELELTVEAPTIEQTISPAPKPGEHFGVDTDFDPTLDLADYRLPPFDLLIDYDKDNVLVSKDELEVNKNRIVETLKHYSIGIIKIKATIGPTVTLYEVVPAPGIRIAKIKNLEDDIALSLSAIGIRIIAPIPGKGTVGIEVPNQNPNIVSMKSILTSEKFRNNNFDLPFGIGKTISNESFVADLARMPHLLMAGATGQGKSVGLNAIIASLLYTKHPAELKFILVDPKKVELNLYSRIERHYLAKLPDSEDAIITDTRKVVRTLNSLSIEMDNRYELLKDAQVRNIKEYNKKFISRKLNPIEGHRFLPYLVLVIDEFADLIMTAGKEVEAPITRLAQLARAIGIHLIIATQRPSVNIITGTIKANFPARIAFRVISKIDSRTILDTGGADQLVGRGDMLFSTGSDLIRIQCAFVDTPEIEKITSYIGAQRAYPDALHLPEFKDEEAEKKADYNPKDRDELFEDAALLIVQTQQGSTSLLQRKLKLGYNRAGRIIDQLEAAGIVGPFEGSKAREVKVGSEMALEQFLKDLDSTD